MRAGGKEGMARHLASTVPRLRGSCKRGTGKLERRLPSMDCGRTGRIFEQRLHWLFLFEGSIAYFHERLFVIFEERDFGII